MSDDASPPRTFDELFRAEYPTILRAVVFIVQDRDLAKEVTSDAFARLYVRWARVSRYDKPGAWVRRVAIRLAVRQQERRTRHVPLVDVPTEHDPGVRLDVRAAVAALPPKQRAAVMLHYFEGLPLREVAGVLGCREGTAKAHLHQARAKLSVSLAAYEPAG